MVSTGPYEMQITRLLFDESEAPESIARRIVRAFSPGEIFCIRGKYFKVSIMRTANETIRENVVEDKYTLVLNVDEREPVSIAPVTTMPVTLFKVKDSEPEETEIEQVKSISEPPPSAVIQLLPNPKRNRESGKYRIERTDAAKVTREGPQKILPVSGEVWQTKDTRRLNSPPFTVLSVDAEFAYTDKGARISLKRWRNYRLVDLSVEVSRQSSG